MPRLSMERWLIGVHRRAVRHATCTMLHVTPTLLVDASSLDGMMARQDAPSSHATCNMHHTTCYAHSAGECPVFRDAGSQVQLQYS